MVLTGFPANALAANEGELCIHHEEHDEFCSYVEAVEGSPCSHEHTDICYRTLAEEWQENSLDGTDEDITFGTMETGEGELNCQHVHDEFCGYAEAVEGQPCTYACEICDALDQQLNTDSNLFATVPMAENTSNVWNGSVADSYAGGSGTSGDPYLIATAEQLAKVADDTNSAESAVVTYYRLTSDIYLNDINNWNLWPEIIPANSWTPIGNVSHPFKGTFDGNGHAIFGAYVNSIQDYQPCLLVDSIGHISKIAITLAVYLLQATRLRELLVIHMVQL